MSCAKHPYLRAPVWGTTQALQSSTFCDYTICILDLHPARPEAHPEDPRQHLAGNVYVVPMRPTAQQEWCSARLHQNIHTLILWPWTRWPYFREQKLPNTNMHATAWWKKGAKAYSTSLCSTYIVLNRCKLSAHGKYNTFTKPNKRYVALEKGVSRELSCINTSKWHLFKFRVQYKLHFRRKWRSDC